MHSSNVLKAVCVTAELCGRTFTEAAARVFCDDLAAYPEDAVLAALTRCRREVKGMLTTQDVISRLDDGRPGVEEAWALIPAGEDETIVWTAEMAEAHAACAPLLASDRIAARMTFKEVYAKAVTRAVAAGEPVRWSASLGWDMEKRQRAFKAAVEAGKLPALEAREECPALPLTKTEKLALPAPNPKRREDYRAKVSALIEAKRDPENQTNPKAWAHELKRRDEAGEYMPLEVREAYQRALFYAVDEGVLFAGREPIPDHVLPRGMRRGGDNRPEAE